MRLPALIAIFAGMLLAACAVHRHVNAESSPRLRIKSVAIPQERSLPLRITLELAADGDTTIAVSQQQFSVQLFTDEQLAAFISNASFATNAPLILRVSPHEPVTIILTTSADRFTRRLWSDVPPGKYLLRVYINSSKRRQFDSQWLGQTHSDGYKLEVN